MTMTATYSPEDNKLRLYASARLDAATYARVKAAGFRWAPKQELFVAPAWSPGREDLLTDLAGEVGDEDTSLVERSEERAERFEDYGDKRAEDAERAREAVSAIADNIPLGQPILVGHHSERHARRDAEKIENGMRRAVKMWETSKYWEQRAAGAIAHAKYKERPDVRARRIKGIEADARKLRRADEKAGACLALWESCRDLKQARFIAGNTEAGWLPCCPHPSLPQSLNPSDVLPFEDRNDYARDHYPTWTIEQVQERARAHYPAVIAAHARWLAHYANRLAYERAMLADQGASALLDKKPRPKQLPLCNYRAPDGITIENDYNPGTTIHYPQVEMTAADYAKINGDYRGTRVVGRSHRVRTSVQRGHRLVSVFLTDSKTHERPADLPAPVRVPRERAAVQPAPERTDFDAMRDSLRAGVQVVSAPNLFPTPTEVAERMIGYANIRPDDRVLEPSAGTGRLVNMLSGKGGEMVAVEVNHAMAESLRRNWQGIEVRCADFLACNGDLGQFDRVVMNPPFDHGADIRHVRHALGLLRPGGRLVAIVADGPRQREAFRDEAEHWEELPAGTFSGTNVRAAIVVIQR